ncbi:50S ribosomal protein L22 [bacterium]|nr:50S ribosomal protein L22 [bacterium]
MTTAETLRRVNVEQKNIRISPYKLRRVADVIRGKETSVALSLLTTLPHSGSHELKKLLSSAIANARHNLGANESTRFVVDTLFVNAGPMGKRFQPKGRGRIYQILKRTSHIVLSIKEV